MVSRNERGWPEMTKRLLLCAVLLTSVAASAGAGTSFFGPSGLLVMPTADTLDRGQIQLFANYINLDDYEEIPVGINAGLGFGIEVGASSVSETGMFAGTSTLVNVKWTALPETAIRPAVAVGAINAGRNEDFTGTIIRSKEKGKVAPYFVATKKLAVPGCGVAITGSAGYIGGNLSGPMLGVDAKVMPKLDLMADWIGSYSNLSIGARYQATDSLGVHASSINGDFAIGTAYTFTLK